MERMERQGNFWVGKVNNKSMYHLPSFDLRASGDGSTFYEHMNHVPKVTVKDMYNSFLKLDSLPGAFERESRNYNILSAVVAPEICDWK